MWYSHVIMFFRYLGEWSWRGHCRFCCICCNCSICTHCICEHPHLPYIFVSLDLHHVRIQSVYQLYVRAHKHVGFKQCRIIFIHNRIFDFHSICLVLWYFQPWMVTPSSSLILPQAPRQGRPSFDWPWSGKERYSGGKCRM